MRIGVNNFAFGRRINAGNHVKGRCFAGTVRANQSNNFMVINFYVQFINSGYAAKLHGNIIGF